MRAQKVAPVAIGASADQSLLQIKMGMVVEQLTIIAGQDPGRPRGGQSEQNLLMHLIN
jgi:hypothetical protein